MQKEYPKISIVTPSYNQGQYIEETILSVIGQNYPNLEYIIIDGGSTDNSVEIIKKYEKHLAYWVSEPDGGMYEAIQKGFAKSTGEIMAWINSDDMLHPKGLFSISEIFYNFPEVKWIHAALTGFDEQGRTIGIGTAINWSKYKFYLDHFGGIQQENSVWRRSLWEQVGACMDLTYKYAGDYELWSRFFRHSQPLRADILFGGFRIRREGQLSKIYQKEYLKESAEIIARERKLLDKKTKKKYTYLRYLFKIHNKLRKVSIHLLEKKIENLIEASPTIIFNHKLQKFEVQNL